MANSYRHSTSFQRPAMMRCKQDRVINESALLRRAPICRATIRGQLMSAQQPIANAGIGSTAGMPRT